MKDLVERKIEDAEERGKTIGEVVFLSWQEGCDLPHKGRAWPQGRGQEFTHSRRRDGRIAASTPIFLLIASVCFMKRKQAHPLREKRGGSVGGLRREKRYKIGVLGNRRVNEL